MNGVLLAVIIVGAIGLIASIGLAVASVVMAVPKNEKAESIEGVLPGANCGACGYSGCAGYAEAMAKGEAKVGLCSPGGAEVAAAVAALLGTGEVQVEKKTALVHCMGSYDNTWDKMEYQGQKSCAAAVQLFGGVGACSYGCMGLGDCAAVCEYGAITICNGVANISPEACRGCSKCVAACPKHLISFVPFRTQAVVRCSNCDKGGETRKVCQVGCIGCMRCVKACEYGAVKVENFHARVDPDLCTACGKCAEVCPQHCISIVEFQ